MIIVSHLTNGTNWQENVILLKQFGGEIGLLKSRRKVRSIIFSNRELKYSADLKQ